MPFRFPRQAHTTAVALVLAGLFGFSGCNRSSSKEEKALRAELREALRARAYEKAAALAQRVLAIKPRGQFLARLIERIINFLRVHF